MPAHVDHQHVLCLEGLLLSRAFFPPTHKLLLLSVDVVIVDVLEKKRRQELKADHEIFSKCNIILNQLSCCSALGGKAVQGHVFV